MGVADGFSSRRLRSGTAEVDPFASGQLAVGEETVPRAIASTAGVLSSGVTKLCYFSARKSQTIATARGASLGAGSGVTHAYFCVYSINAAGDGTLIGSTADDTSLFAGATTAYSKAFASPFQLIRGARYAAGILVTVTTTMPTIYSAPGTVASELAQAPRLSGIQGSGLTAPAASFLAAGVSLTNGMIYVALLP